MDPIVNFKLTFIYAISVNVYMKLFEVLVQSRKYHRAYISSDQDEVTSIVFSKKGLITTRSATRRIFLALSSFLF